MKSYTIAALIAIASASIETVTMHSTHYPEENEWKIFNGSGTAAADLICQGGPYPEWTYPAEGSTTDAMEESGRWDTAQCDFGDAASITI